MATDSFKKAKQAEDGLLDLLGKLVQRREGNFTWLKLSEIHQLQNLEEVTEIAKYVVQGILTEPEVYYNEADGSFYQLNFDKFEESLETLITINRLIYDCPQWIRAAKDRKVLDKHNKALDRHGDRTRALPSILEYWDSHGEPHLADQILQRENADFEASKKDFEAFTREMQRRELNARPNDQQYIQQVGIVVDSLLSKEESKYPNVRIIRKLYLKAPNPFK